MTLTTLIRTIRHSTDIIVRQQRLITELRQELTDRDREIRELHLEAIREMEGIVSAWMIHLELPEVDMRDELAALQSVMGHEIAKAEEHVL